MTGFEVEGVAKAVVWGFQEVYYFDAGFNGWKREGHRGKKNN